MGCSVHDGWSCHQQQEKERVRRLYKSCLGQAWMMVGIGSQVDQSFNDPQLKEMKVITDNSYLTIISIVSSGAVPECVSAPSWFSEVGSCWQQRFWRRQLQRSAVWFPSFQTCPLC